MTIPTVRSHSSKQVCKSCSRIASAPSLSFFSAASTSSKESKFSNLIFTDFSSALSFFFFFLKFSTVVVVFIFAAIFAAAAAAAAHASAHLADDFLQQRTNFRVAHGGYQRARVRLRLLQHAHHFWIHHRFHHFRVVHQTFHSRREGSRETAWIPSRSTAITATHVRVLHRLLRFLPPLFHLFLLFLLSFRLLFGFCHSDFVEKLLRLFLHLGAFLVEIDRQPLTKILTRLLVLA
mmetsp:Transcript_3635/g.12170  ORF Transcript_3635/g.12170 Transcript_3635/m.12170 type:complete len:235 (-) Transcript_3635:608-1312(-)